MSPEVEQAVGLAREFLHRSGALRVGLLVDRGDDREPAVVECARLAPISVIEDGEREEVAHGAPLSTPVPPLPEVRQIFGIEADPVAATVPATGSASMPKIWRTSEIGRASCRERV